MKEPFYVSVRFWTTVVTLFVTALLPILAEKLPFLADLKPESISVVIAAWVVTFLGYIVARTVRNTPSNR